MSAVTMPMPITVMSSTFLRPTVSPIAPKIAPPTGRATRPTPNVANAAMALSVALSVAKYCTLKTSAAAAEKRKKSYHSIALPTSAPRATLLASLVVIWLVTLCSELASLSDSSISSPNIGPGVGLLHHWQ